jgi:hypothetical protein
MKILISTKASDFDVVCDNMIIENGFIVLENPVFKFGNMNNMKKTYIPVGNINFLTILED